MFFIIHRRLYGDYIRDSTERTAAIAYGTKLFHKGTEVAYSISNPKVVEVCEMMRAILAERASIQRDLLQSMKE